MLDEQGGLQLLDHVIRIDLSITKVDFDVGQLLAVLRLHQPASVLKLLLVGYLLACLRLVLLFFRRDLGEHILRLGVLAPHLVRRPRLYLDDRVTSLGRIP